MERIDEHVNYNCIYADADVVRKQYAENKEEWEAVIDFFRTADLCTLQTGKHELTSNGTFASVQRYVTRESGEFEAHRKYIDVQYVVSGKEVIELAERNDLRTETMPYDQDKDIEFYSSAENISRLHLKTGDSAVFFPSDAHKPCLSDGEKSDVVKIVVKIPYFESDK